MPRFHIDSSGLLYKVDTDGEFPSVIELPRGVKTLCENLFSQNHDIVQVFLNDGLEEIGAYSFIDCWRLETVVMPKTLRTIRESAFRNCYGLQNVILNDGIREIGSMAFKRTAIREVDIPRSVESIGDLCFTKCKSLQTVRILGENVNLGNMMFNGDMNLQNVECPDSLKRKVKLEMLNV